MRRLLTWVVAGALVLATALGLATVLVYRSVREAATACFASIEAPRGAVLPDCERFAARLWLPLRAPWTRRASRWLVEEITVRMAVARYVDAAIGHPDPEHLDAAREAVRAAATELDAGTARLRLDELGPMIPAPDPFDLAADLGDHRGLVGHQGPFPHWYTARRALDWALARGRASDAVRLAADNLGRGADELELAAGAVLCAHGDMERGLPALVDIQDLWARKRKANFARAYGGARVLVEACAALGAKAAPPLPSGEGGGPLDHVEQRAVLRLRLAERADGCDPAAEGARCGERPIVHERVEDILATLGSGEALRHRLALAASVLPYVTGAERARALVAPAVGEVPSELGAAPLDWLTPARDEPFVPAERWASAADAVRAMARGHAELEPLAARLALGAARAFAVRGDGSAAQSYAGRSGDALGPGGARLAQALAAYLVGELPAALELLAGEPGAERAPFAALRAEIIAEIGHVGSREPGAGRMEDVSRAIAQGLEAPRTTDAAPESRRTAAARERLGWLGSCVLPPAGGESLAGPVDLPPFVGHHSMSPAGVRRERLEAAQAAWRRMRAGSGAEWRSDRYAVLRRRGDAPPALGSYLACAAALVDEPAEVEPWLDAFVAVDLGALGLRAHAFARAVAARLRGDAAAAAVWTETYRTLARDASDPARAELFQALRY
ncbi:MAG: hypothetical protein IT373_07375 [Polyangiaceae bacterium]|nr:hypothetical protein [Polyangiaceae bacterium]